MDAFTWDFRVHYSKADLKGTDYVEIGPGNFSGRYWQEGFVFVDEDAFGVVEGIVRKHFSKYDPRGVTGLSRETGAEIVAEWRAVAAGLNGMSLEAARAALNIEGSYYDTDLVHAKTAITRMLIQLADTFDTFYRAFDRVCIIGV